MASLLVGAVFSRLASRLRSSSRTPPASVKQTEPTATSQGAGVRRRFGGTKASCPAASATSLGQAQPEEQAESARLAPLCSPTAFPWGKLSFSWGLNLSLWDWKSSSAPAAELSPGQLYAQQQLSQGECEALKYTLRGASRLSPWALFISDIPSGAISELNTGLQKTPRSDFPCPGDAARRLQPSRWGHPPSPTGEGERGQPARGHRRGGRTALPSF